MDGSDIIRGLASGSVTDVVAVRASRIGDLLMTTPALHAFRRLWPSVQITFVTNAYSAPVLDRSPDVDRIVVFDGKEADLARRLPAGVERADLVLGLRPRPELRAFAAQLGADLWPRTDPSPDDRSRHVTEQCFDRLRPLVEGEPGPLRLTLGPADHDAVSGRLPAGAGPLVVMHPGCDETLRFKLRRGVRRRVWPREHWCRLVDAVAGAAGARIVLTSGSAVEARWVDAIAAACTAPLVHLRRPALRELAAAIAAAAVVVTVDTGPLHIATAVGTPLVGLYGPSPVSYTGPWAPGGVVSVLRTDLPCAPCQGRDVVCPRNVCMEEIDPAAVLGAVLRSLGPAQA